VVVGTVVAFEEVVAVLIEDPTTIKLSTIKKKVYVPMWFEKGPSCPSGYDAGLTNQTSLVPFPSPLNFS